jgi:ribosomal protein S12 methylthiotransferase accessory factor
MDAKDGLPPGNELFRDSLNVEPGLFLSRLEKTRVSVISFGGVSTAPLIAILQAIGIRVAAEGDFTVVMVDDYLRRELEGFNREAIRRERPWMIVKPAGNVFWLGPVFCPPLTACWNCLALRLRRNRQAEAFIQAHRGNRELFSLRFANGLSSIADAALNLAATETLKWIVRRSGDPAETLLLTLDAREMKTEKHAVIRLDDCSSCASHSRKAKSSRGRIVLKSCKKIFTSDGGHRSTSSETTFQKYEHLISPLTGVVDRLRSYYSDDSGLVHAYLAGHIFVPVFEKQALLQRGLRQKSAGKGMTPQQARTSALCEALERYSGVFRNGDSAKRATFKALGDKAIHPNRCMNFSPEQYESRNEWNRRHSDYDWVPLPFDENRVIHWTRVWSLTGKMFKYVPTAYCYYGYRLPPEHAFCRADSNGNAAGNALEEAILHGFLELVERDSAALWWYNRLSRQAVNLDSFAHPYLGALRDHYHALGRDIWVLDITSDFGIPAFAAVSRTRNADDHDFILGMGAHFDPLIAIARALTEMNQFLPGILSGRRGRVLELEGFDTTFLKPDPKRAPKNVGDFTRRATDDFRDDVIACVKLAEALGLETLVLDQTRSDVGLSVVKVIVPGMRQFWARFGEGRLYDVPVKMGWLKKRLTEEQLNPVRFFV